MLKGFLLLCFICRYQPTYEEPKYTPEKAALAAAERESAVSESQINMIEENRFRLQALVNPSSLPTEQTATIVNFLVGLLGKYSAVQTHVCIKVYSGIFIKDRIKSPLISCLLSVIHVVLCAFILLDESI